MKVSTLQLPASLELAALAGIKDDLAAALGRNEALIVEGYGVERVGTPAVQLLLATAAEAAANHLRFILAAPSPALTAAFEDLGLADHLREWSVP